MRRRLNGILADPKRCCHEPMPSAGYGGSESRVPIAIERGTPATRLIWVENVPIPRAADTLIGDGSTFFPYRRIRDQTHPFRPSKS